VCIAGIRILDDAVKIGLGAMIGFIGSIVAMFYSFKHERIKTKKENYRMKICEAIECLEKVKNGTADYIAKTIAFIELQKQAYTNESFDRVKAEVLEAGNNFQKLRAEALSKPTIFEILELKVSAQKAANFLHMVLDPLKAIEDNEYTKNMNIAFSEFIESAKNDYQSTF
jgi:hypothetical protein